MKIEILPAILSKTSSDYHQKLKAIEPLTDWVQIDVVDNIYARNQTIDDKVVASIRTSVNFEVQLMVEHIEDWVDRFVKLRPGRIIVPLESAREPILLIRHLSQHNIPFGFSIEPKTPVERLQHLIDKIDVVLLLAVHPGFSGQHFAFNVLDKIRALRQMRQDIVIEIDGGIEPDTAAKCAAAGANILASGSFIFDHPQGSAGSSENHNATIEGETYNDKVRNAYQTLTESVADIIPESNV